MQRKTIALLIGSFVLLCCLVMAAGLFIYNTTKKAAPPPLIFPTRGPTAPPGQAEPTPGASVQPGTAQPGPTGKIVFVCQLFKLQAKDQLCIINADGTGWRRLTPDDAVRSFYPSLAPDGNSVVYSSNQDGNFKLYEITLTGEVSPLGNTVGYAPEVSPDNKQVVFTNSDGKQEMIWVMNRDGGNRRLLYRDAWDPTWSPDGSQVLFATHVNDKPQLAIINLDGSGFKHVTNMPLLRGRSDWSADGAHITTYSGESWAREVYLFNADGTGGRAISPADGNSQGPSFSPDGQWIAFTAYYGSIRNENGCEIYIMTIDGGNLTRLTENTYCDWQPRWGR